MSALTARCIKPEDFSCVSRGVTHVANPEPGRERSRRIVPHSCGEQMKLLSERQLLIAGIFRLLFPHHMDQLDAPHAEQDHGSIKMRALGHYDLRNWNSDHSS